jgi:kumamolisin
VHPFSRSDKARRSQADKKIARLVCDPGKPRDNGASRIRASEEGQAPRHFPSRAVRPLAIDDSERRPLRCSIPVPFPGAFPLPGKLKDEPLDVTIRLRASMHKTRSTFDRLGRLSLRDRQYLTRSEFQSTVLPSPADVELVHAFAKRFGLSVIASSAAGRSLQVRGSTQDIANAFGVCLELYEFPHGQYRSHRGQLLLPADLLPAVESVSGLENRRQSEPLCTRGNSQTIAASYPTEIAHRYGFPSNLSGKGECIGILQFGGGIAPVDLTRYFLQLHGTVPDLRFQNLTATNQPNVNSKHDKEVALDIELAGALAPGARIVTYFSTNDEKGWVDALTRAIHDDENRPSILSISWGATEDWWRTETVVTLTQLFQEAAGLGITICAASGDEGCAMDAQGHCRVTFPASSPFVLACGGTSFKPDGREVVWNVRNDSASGGGISDFHPRPYWQPQLASTVSSVVPCRRNPNFDGRGLPDVSGPADHLFDLYVGGRHHYGAGGTSAVAPFWSALVARVNEGLRERGLPRVGYLNPLLYQESSLQKTFHEITSGHNDPFGNRGYRARTGWDPCTGWGTPDGQRLLEELVK